MLLALIVAFVLVPLAELAVIVQVGSAIGMVDTLGLLLLVSLIGGLLVKHQGVGVLRRIGVQLDLGRVPGRELVDGALILLAGALLLTPGFITDALGLVLLLPPVRAGARAVLRRRFARRVEVRRYLVR